MDDPTEEIQKHLHDEAHHQHDPSLLRIALSSAIIAVLAAIASLLSEHQVNEALIGQLRASDQWAYYQAKGIKRTILDAQLQILEAVNKPDEKKKASLEAGLDKYEKEQEDISKLATSEQIRSQKALEAHSILSYAVTVLQVAIGLSAVAALTRRRWLWFTSMGIAAGGLCLLVWGSTQAFFF